MFRPALRCAAALLAAAPAAARSELIHPDTLPSMIEQWALDASLGDEVAPTNMPRFTLEGETLYVHDHEGAQLLSVDVASGKAHWFQQLPRRLPSSNAFQPHLYEGKRLFVAANRSLYYLNAENGKVVWRVPLPGAGTGKAWRLGDLLVFATLGTGKEGPNTDVFALSLKSGKFVWNQRFGSARSYLVADDKLPYLLLDDGQVMALSIDTGKPIWRVRVKGETGVPILDGGQIVFSVKNKTASLVALKSASGEKSWDFPVDSFGVRLLPTKDTLLVMSDSGSVQALNTETGKATWSVDAPLSSRALEIAAAADETRAYVHYTQEHGPPLLALVDLSKKRLLASANGLSSGATSAELHGKFIVYDTHTGDVRSIRVDRSQRPKRKVVSPADYARELAETAPRSTTKEEALRLADSFVSLGQQATPVVIGLLKSRDAHVVGIAALALGQLGAKSAVSALATALERERKRDVPVTEPVHVSYLLVRALGRARQPSSVAALVPLLDDKKADHHTRRAAFVALGNIGTPKALDAINQFKAQFAAGSTDWKPVPVTDSLYLPVGADPVLGSAADDVRMRTSISAKDSSGKQLVVSLSPYLGGYNDIWAFRSDDGQKWDKPLFTGVTHPMRGPRQHIDLVRLDVRPTGFVLTYKLPRGQQRKIFLAWQDLEKDRDGDGLPDKVEKRLGTKADQADTDGDGLDDGKDINPRSPASNKPSDTQMLYREAFLAYFAFLRSHSVVVVDRGFEARIEYPGRFDPVISLRRRAIGRFQEEAGLWAIDYVGFGGPFKGEDRSLAADRVTYNAKKNEALLGIDISRSGSSAVGYNVKLKRYGDRWVVTDMEEAWRKSLSD